MSIDHSLAQRLEFMKLDASSLTRVRGLKPLIDRELPAARDTFYEQVKQFPEVARFFSNADHIGRAKGAQLRHWANISSGDYSEDYARSVRTIGQTHARIGLEPRWYIGGYNLVLGHLIECPKHNGQFDYRTGQAMRAPVCVNLATYPVKVEGGHVHVEVP